MSKTKTVRKMNMILAEKIIEERKKNGWSQEELADKLGVSRQSVSKWESAQSVPDLQRILEMGKLFDVTTDYLLKDEEGIAESTVTNDSGKGLRRLSMEEANSFLKDNDSFARKISLGTFICTLCAAPLLVIMSLQKGGIIGLSEDAAGALGIVILLALVALSLIFFIPAGMSISKWEWLEKEIFDSEYGVDGMVRSRSEKFTPVFAKAVTGGIVTIMLGVIALISGAVINEKDEALLIGLTGVLLICCATGVYFIVKAGIIKDGFSKLLQEGDYSRSEKSNKLMKIIAPAYWMLVTAGFLAWSFLTNDWGKTWIVWPIAGILFGVITVVVRALHKEE